MEIVKSSVDMPAVESSVFTVFVCWDCFFMEGFVVRVLQFDVVKSLKFLDWTIANDLDWTPPSVLELRNGLSRQHTLWLMGNRLEIGMQNTLGLLRHRDVAMTIDF